MRRLYLIGYPVAHSISPQMQGAAIEALGLDYIYEAMPVTPEGLGRAVAGLRDPSVAGFNVTIPHKIAILPLLDEVDATAMAVSAINTVVNEDGRLKGYNTDSPAAVRAIGEAYGNLDGCRVVILGAGGAARAVASGLAPKARWIRILTRDAAKADSLAGEVGKQHEVDVLGVGLGEARSSVGAADILVNATPVGMSPNVGHSPVDARTLHPGLLVFDLIYSPERTRLLLDAEAAGAETLGGLTMLVYQGAEALRLWTGRRAPEDVMMGAARQALGGGTH